MRIPPLVTDYVLSICSADFNEWVGKNAATAGTLGRYSYIWGGEYEIFEFDLGSTFNYAEMAALIAPRPFMVERGHFDGVAPDESVAWEFAKVKFLYDELGAIADAKWKLCGPHDQWQRHFRFPPQTSALARNNSAPRLAEPDEALRPGAGRAPFRLRLPSAWGVCGLSSVAWPRLVILCQARSQSFDRQPAWPSAKLMLMARAAAARALRGATPALPWRARQ
jgi:hypothetical protein